jgi:putative endonuclease
MEKKTIGTIGEQIAADYLIKDGYKIIARNWVFNHKELDIVALKDDNIVFVEVKTRNNVFDDSARDLINFKKQKMLVEAANHYITKYNIDLEARFDVAIVVLKSSGNQISIICNAFSPIARSRP